jgi:hypothetical protein
MATTTGPEAAGSEQANSDEQTAEAERVGGVLEPTDRREIISWFAYDWCVREGRKGVHPTLSHS